MTKESKESMFEMFEEVRTKAIKEVMAGSRDSSSLLLAETEVCSAESQALGEVAFKMMAHLSDGQKRIVLCSLLSAFIDSHEDMHYLTVMLGVFAELRNTRQEEEP